MIRALAIFLLVMFNLTSNANAAQNGWFEQESRTPLMLAADTEVPDKKQKPDAAKKDKDGENCQWACQRWGKKCNVDSRTGKYKCKRSCEKFGKICD